MGRFTRLLSGDANEQAPAYPRRLRESKCYRSGVCGHSSGRCGPIDNRREAG